MTGLGVDQVKLLLTACMGYDNRRPGQLNIAAWKEASERGYWTFEFALEAIHSHYSRTDDFITPAAVTKMVKSMREHEAALAAQEERRQLSGPERDWRPVWETALAESKAARSRRRSLVLGHADLREALTLPPIGFKEPQQWNGFVPAGESVRATALRDVVLEAEYRQDNR